MKDGRAWVWLQIIIAWVPVWALYAFLLGAAHPGVTFTGAISAATWAIAVAAVLGIFVVRFTERIPLTRPLTARFFVYHILLALGYAIFWMLIAFVFELQLHSHSLAIRIPAPTFLPMGVWLYLIVAGASYATRATERAARAEGIAAKARLASLRSQLNPHFLFNSLHTVVQLIPQDPARAGNAAEQLAALLRTGIEEDRDLISLSEEIAFVERYLALEKIRFGDRLDVSVSVDPATRELTLPSFSIQTLVENAVRHGVEKREGKTSVEIRAGVIGRRLEVTVRDAGAGMQSTSIGTSGTGLARLAERLGYLYGSSASVEAGRDSGGAYLATLTVPVSDD